MRSTDEEKAAGRFSILLSPGFVGGLGLLFLNDFFLKPTFHNWLTGKLSDFVGLFIFPLFFVALRPRLKLPVYLGTAVLFLLWKSPFAGPWIDLWNEYIGFTVGRVEDQTDLIALLALPVSYFYESHIPKVRISRSAACLICLLSAFAFTATSIGESEQTYTDEYQFAIGQKELVARMEKLHEIEIRWREGMTAEDMERKKKLRLDSPFACQIDFHSTADGPSAATVVVSESNGRSIISLLKLSGRGSAERREPWRKYFEKEFIEPLRQGSVAGSHRIRSIHQS